MSTAAIEPSAPAVLELYPELPGGLRPEYHRQEGVIETITPMGDDTQNFRLTRVSAIEAELRQERDARVKLYVYRKYARAVSVIETASVASNAVAVATGAGGGGGFATKPRIRFKFV